MTAAGAGDQSGGTLVYLVRHGRTALNAAGALRGHLDPPLDEVGRAEADRLGALFTLLIAEPPDRIVSSPLGRARQTATAIARSWELPVEIEGDLIDRDYGPVAGRSRGEIEAELGLLDTIDGVEPVDRFLARVASGFDRVVERSAGRRIVIVAHDAVNRGLLWRLLPGRFAGPDAVPQRTGCWNRLERVDGTWQAPVIDAVPGDGHTP